MVHLRNDYIELVFPEDLANLGDDDRLYIFTEEGDYLLHPKMMFQYDDDGIMFIADERLVILDYDDIDMYMIADKTTNQLDALTGEISGFENFMMGILCGVMIMIVLLCIGC